MKISELEKEQCERFKKNLKYLTCSRGLKIRNLEREIGVSPGYLSRIDEHNIGVIKILRLSNILGVSVDDLFCLDIEREDHLIALGCMKGGLAYGA